MAVDKKNGKRNKFLVARNLTSAPVSFRNEDEDKDVYIPGYGEIAVRPISDWENAPDVDRLRDLGLIETYRSHKRPKAMPRLPGSLEPKIPSDRSTVHELATMNDQELELMIINVEPEFDRFNTQVREEYRNIDLGYLRSRHRTVLRAALWLIEHNPYLPEWRDERIQAIKDRLAWIDNLAE